MTKFAVAITQLEEDATRVVQAMRDALVADKAARARGEPPLNRLAIKDLILNAGRQYLLHEFLVKKGMLKELVGWLADFETNELAPVDLRMAALSVLDMMPYEGITGSGIFHRKEPLDDSKTGKKGGMLNADNFSYEGVSAEDLAATKIGWAVNFVRKHPQESAANRTTATRLLERFSRVFRGGDEADEDAASAGGRRMWASQGDTTILPPFEVQVPMTQRFLDRRLKPDPNDPITYLKQRRPWSKPAYISGVSGAGVVDADDGGGSGGGGGGDDVAAHGSAYEEEDFGNNHENVEEQDNKKNKSNASLARRGGSEQSAKSLGIDSVGSIRSFNSCGGFGAVKTSVQRFTLRSNK